MLSGVSVFLSRVLVLRSAVLSPVVIMTTRNVQYLSKNEFKSFFDSFDTVISDCDGVLWLGEAVIPGSPDVMNKFKDLGKQIFYITNNSTKTRQEFVHKCQDLGFPATEESILGTAYLTACYLQDLDFKKKVYIVGSKGISQELDAICIKHLGVGPDPMKSNLNTLLKDEVHLDPEVGAVVVGYDVHFSVPKMVKAASYLSQPGCHFIATNTDEVFPTEYPLTVPGAGTYVKAIETVAMRDSFKIGKPSPYVSEVIVKRHKVDPKRTLMIGDKCSTDILFGTRCGFTTLLVLTGVTKLKEIEELEKSDNEEVKKMVPNYYINCLGDLLSFIS